MITCIEAALSPFSEEARVLNSMSKMEMLQMG